jgi:hypothetical protein
MSRSLGSAGFSADIAAAGSQDGMDAALDGADSWLGYNVKVKLR